MTMPFRTIRIFRRSSAALLSIFFLFLILAPLHISAGQKNPDGSASYKLPPDTDRLVGRWQRPDGGYIIEIKAVESNGQINAAYYNPKHIHVEKALVKNTEGRTHLFIELQDVGYPGATYNLIYIPEHDALAGYYYQPALKQTFEVVFYRDK